MKTGTTRANFYSSGKTPVEIEQLKRSVIEVALTGAAIFNNLLEMLSRPVAFLSERLRNSSKTLAGQMRVIPNTLSVIGTYLRNDFVVSSDSTASISLGPISEKCSLKASEIDGSSVSVFWPISNVFT